MLTGAMGEWFPAGESDWVGTCVTPPHCGQRACLPALLAATLSERPHCLQENSTTPVLVPKGDVLMRILKWLLRFRFLLSMRCAGVALYVLVIILEAGLGVTIVLRPFE